MPRTTKQLTHTEVKLAKPKNKEYNLADGRGLYLRIKPNNAKLWIFNYTRPITKKRANLGLGIFPDLSLADAREKAQELRSVLTKGIDPQEFRQAQELKAREAYANTFQVVAERWLKLKRPNVSDTYYKKIDDRLSKYVFPKLGNIPVHKITAVDAIQVIMPVADEGKLETVKKLCRWINEIMVYAVNTGVHHSNPLAGIGKAFNAPKAVNLPTIKPSELPELMLRLGSSNTKLVTRCLIEWQLHTMVRPGEAAGTRWKEIDLKKALWTIPAERMKMNRTHVVPLTTQTLNILEILKPVSGHREFVFPSDHKPRRSANSQSANRALKRIGFHGRLVSHGLRALASTTLNEQGFDSDVIEAALAHVDTNAIRAAYNRSDYLEKRKKMMQWWSDHIESAAVGNMSLSGFRNLNVIK
ncbi:MAG: tyrosine-type recombinase/integrase [Pseudomonadales bacterium]|nr:tyrosine-type recombinase/integrase [Pseudomonadales bacterium]